MRLLIYAFLYTVWRLIKYYFEEECSSLGFSKRKLTTGKGKICYLYEVKMTFSLLQKCILSSREVVDDMCVVFSGCLMLTQQKQKKYWHISTNISTT